MGRDARGVRGINLRKGDLVVGMTAFQRDTDEQVLTVCERGYGKRTALGEYPTKNRGGMGVIAIKTSARNGPVAGVRLIRDEDHLILISTTGRLIRMPGQHHLGGGPRDPGRAHHARSTRTSGSPRSSGWSSPEDTEGIAEAAPEAGTDDGDTVPVDMTEVVDDEDGTKATTGGGDDDDERRTVRREDP